MLEIFTFHHKRPDFIGLQLESFRKHLKEPFRFTVFNNAAFDLDKKNYLAIYAECRRLDINHIAVALDLETANTARHYTVGPVFHANMTYHNANVACAYPLVWAWKTIISQIRGSVLILDSDIFLTEPIVFSDYLSDANLCFVLQAYEHVKYAWNGFILADLTKLPEPASMNWWCGQIDGVPVDVGGQTHWYLKTHPEVPIFYVRPDSRYEDPSVDFQPSAYEILHLGDKKLLHYRSGSNWNHQSEDYHSKKTRWLHKVLNESH